MRVKLNGNDFFDVSSQFGAIDSVHKTPHTGIDLVMESGHKLFSPTDGTISRIVDYGSENIGKGIIIKTDEGENLILGHLSDTSSVHVGQEVHTGDFLALSGNTGRSTGSHLHLGLRDQNGTFVSPEKLLSDSGQVVSQPTNGGFMSDITGFIDLLKKIGEEGFFQAVYGKSFFEVVKGFTVELLTDVYNFILANGDMIFICPAIIIMFGTFFVGKNKFTKWIVPLWFGYFVTVVLELLKCLPPQ